MTERALRPEQVLDVAAGMQHDRIGLFHDPGVGKTPPACVLIWWRWKDLQQKSAWLMPKSLFDKNRQELLDWSGFKPEDVLILDQVPIEVRKLQLAAAARERKLKLVTVADARMINVLDATNRMILYKENKRWTAPGNKIDQNAVKKAAKLGWLTIPDEGKPVITEAGKEALAGGLVKTEYQLAGKPTGRALVEAMIAEGLLILDPVTGLISMGTLSHDLMWITKLKFEAKVLIMGFDFFSENWRWIMELNPEVQAASVDEIHLGFGDINSQRTMNFVEAMRQIPAFIPMTGTLVNGKLSTAYPTIHLIEPRYYAGYDDFLAQHEVQDEFGKRVGWKNHDKIRTILERHGRRRSFEAEYGKEAKVMQVEWVEMSPRLREQYDIFHQEAMLELEDRFLDGSLPGVATIRARQIMQCPEIFGLGKDEELGKDERLKVYLGDCLEDGEPFVIYSAFQPEHERLVNLVDAMGLRVGMINGSVSSTNRTRIDLAFQKRELDVVIASEATAGIGFNWGHVNRMAFASCDYQDGNFFQAYRRAIRGIRDRSLLIYVLGYRNTVDHRVFQIIDQKSRDANKVDPTREVLNLSQRAA